MPRIKKEDNITEVIQKYPQTYEVFAKYGIGCVGCMLAAYETIEQGIAAHGIDVDEFMKDLNAAIGESEEEA